MAIVQATEKSILLRIIQVTKQGTLRKHGTYYTYDEGDVHVEFVTRGMTPSRNGYIVEEVGNVPFFINQQEFDRRFQKV